MQPLLTQLIFDRFNLILKEIDVSLRPLKRAIAGEVGMSAELDDVAANLGTGNIPASWRRLVPATEKSLADWLQQMLQRNDQYKNWVCTWVPLSWMQFVQRFLLITVRILMFSDRCWQERTGCDLAVWSPSASIVHHSADSEGLPQEWMGAGQVYHANNRH